MDNKNLINSFIKAASYNQDWFFDGDDDYKAKFYYLLGMVDLFRFAYEMNNLQNETTLTKEN